MYFELVDQFGIVQLGSAIFIFLLANALGIWFNLFWNLRKLPVERNDKLVVLSLLAAAMCTAGVWIFLTVLYRQSAKELPAISHLWIVLTFIIAIVIKFSPATDRITKALANRRSAPDVGTQRNKHLAFYIFLVVSGFAALALLKLRS